MKKWLSSILTIEPTLDDAKKIIATYNKMLKGSNNPTEKAYWEYWEKNLNELARNFVKARSQKVLEDEWEKKSTTS